MKRTGLAIVFVISLAVSVSAQVKPSVAVSDHTSSPKSAPAPNVVATRARFSQPNNPTTINQDKAASSPVRQWGNAPLSSSVVLPTLGVSVSQIANVTPTVTAALAQTYRVGVGDILDIQIPDSLSSKSTLYTVSANGTIEYALANGPVQVAGLTTEAVAARLQSSIRVIDASTITVKVRDFASHTVNVIGFVQTPGSKVLRREAVPLYVVLAEAGPLKDATSVTIVRNGQNLAQIDLRNIADTNQLILPGDTIKVSDHAISAK